MRLVQSYGAKQWNLIAKKLLSLLKASPTFRPIVPVRTGKQVRERYHNYLENDYNFDPITGAEAFIIFEL